MACPGERRKAMARVTGLHPKWPKCLLMFILTGAKRREWGNDPDRRLAPLFLGFNTFQRQSCPEFQLFFAVRSTPDGVCGEIPG